MQIRLAPNTANEVVLGTDNISNMDFVKTHTGLSDYDITVQRGLGVHDRVLDELWLEQDDGTLLFRGLLESVDEQEGQDVSPTATLSGHGIGYKLERSSAFIEVTSPTFAQDVIEDFWTNETAFSPTVVDPTPANSISDETAQEASTTSEFANITSIANTDPVAAQNNALELLQTAFTTESDNLTRSNTNLINGTQYSNDETEEIDQSTSQVSLDFTLDYTIPESAVEVWVRFETQGGGTGPGLELSLNGDTWQPVADNAGFGTLDWRDLANDSFGTSETYSGGDLTPGSYTLSIASTTTGDGQLIDVVSPLDGRFSYTFDNTTPAGERVSGPELYPSAFTFAFDSVDTPWNITDATLTTTWDDTTNNQAIQLRLSNQTWFPNDGTQNNTSSITTDFGDEIGQTIQGRATFSRHGTDTNLTPTTGINGQKLQSWEIAYDGNDNPIISAGGTFQGSQLEVAQRLHERADMRFTLLHDKTSLPVESYRPGDNVKALPDLDESSRTNRTDLSGFFNSVEVFGQRDENGDRLSATEKDQASINELGEQYWSVFDPSLDTEEALQSKARAVLNEKLREREDKGEIEIAPENIPAGFSYDNPFNDGSTTIPIEETSYQITRGDISGRLVFDFQTGQRLAEDIGGLRKGTQNAKLGF